MRFTTIAARDTLLLSFEKWGLKPQKQKIAAVLQDRYDLQDCGSFHLLQIEFNDIGSFMFWHHCTKIVVNFLLKHFATLSLKKLKISVDCDKMITVGFIPCRKKVLM